MSWWRRGRLGMGLRRSGRLGRSSWCSRAAVVAGRVWLGMRMNGRGKDESAEETLVSIGPVAGGKRRRFELEEI
uniref:Uncharacterized protein n=1 Tax=Cannabis sativa TaxID=3483 RepID=A0A803PNS4_CANSA